MNEQEKTIKEKKWVESVNEAKQVLKKGDRIRLRKCPGRKRTITFDRWDGNWIVSKSGVNDYSALSIDKLNGKPRIFNGLSEQLSTFLRCRLGTKYGIYFEQQDVDELIDLVNCR